MEADTFFYGNPKWLGKRSIFFKIKNVSISWDALLHFMNTKKCIFDACRLSLHNSTPSHCTNTPLHSMPPLGGFQSEYRHPVWCGKTRMVWLPDGEKILKICLFVLTWSTNVTDGQTDRRTDGHCMTAKTALASHRAVKTRMVGQPGGDKKFQNVYSFRHNIRTIIMRAMRHTAPFKIW